MGEHRTPATTHSSQALAKGSDSEMVRGGASHKRRFLEKTQEYPRGLQPLAYTAP